MLKRLIILIVLLQGFVLMSLPTQAQSVLSAGCTVVNDPFFDDSYISVQTTVSIAFNANEYILVEAGLPIYGGTPTLITLYINGAIVATSSFPGTVAYVIPSTANYEFAWSVNSGGSTWSASCTDTPPPAPPAPPSSPSITTYPCPVFFDGRINNCDTGNKIVIYGHDYETGRGLLITDTEGNNLLLVSPEQIAAVAECPDTNTLIASGGGVSVYRLARTCEFQVNAAAADGKTYVVIFNELYADTGYSSHEE